jgi:hypothetical protein
MAELPMSFLGEEKRLAGRAMQAWRRSQRASVPGFEATSLTIADPGGAALVLSVAPAIAASFGLRVGQSLAGNARDSETEITAELRAACDLVALGGRPVPLEASLIAPDRSVVLLRGVALPLFGPSHDIDTVQAVLSWREVLNRTASQRLHRELGEALRAIPRPSSACSDPFPVTTNSSPRRSLLARER